MLSELEYIKDQETVNTYRESCGIRRDVIAKDSGAIYDIEMQNMQEAGY